MSEKRRGADSIEPTPDNQTHYNRANSLCLAILLICIAIFLVGYAKDIHDIQVAAFGGISTCGLILVALNPIKEQ